MTPVPGQTVTQGKGTFKVVSMGDPEKHANTAAALARRGLHPALCTLRATSGRWTGALYGALYDPRTGLFTDLLKV